MEILILKMIKRARVTRCEGFNEGIRKGPIEHNH